MSSSDRHEHEHELIDERMRALAVSRPKSKLVRRELIKRAANTLHAHLHAMHGVRTNRAVVSTDDMRKLHDELHAAH
jgi:hypothetical protein